jgi:uncharacterized membrane protein/nitrite reductase/ring-hydroxylating ferredoxin subunit
MRSKARLKNHPIHPMLVAFPITFITAAPLFDLAGLIGGWESCWTFGAYSSVATVVTGLVAAVPGLIDFLYVVPPRSSGKRRGWWHMGVNSTALGIVALSWIWRDWATLRPEMMAVLLEVIAVALITVGGWLGGTLVYRNQIGVDHRYAHAGKWREQSVEGKPGQKVAIEGANKLKTGQMILVRTPRRRIVIAKTDDGYAAFDDHCTHRGGSLAGGTLACGTVCCPWHGSQFAADNGEVKAGPAERPIGAYQVEDVGGEIRLVLPG